MFQTGYSYSYKWRDIDFQQDISSSTNWVPKWTKLPEASAACYMN